MFFGQSKAAYPVNENRRRYRIFLSVWLLGTLFLLSGIYLVKMNNAIPGELNLVQGERADFSFSVPASASVYHAQSDESSEKLDLSKPFSLEADSEPVELRIRLFGVLPFKTVDVNVVESKQVVAAGVPIGIYVRTQGVMVIDLEEVKDVARGAVIPAEHILKPGDYILTVNGQAVNSRYDVLSALENLEEADVALTVNRDGSELLVQVTCADTEDGYKLGVWIRDDMQGIGTMTYTDSSRYGALGHSITDQDTGEQVELSNSTLYKATILNIKKGQQGKPGELGGMISYGDAYAIGTIEKNTSQGIFGTLYDADSIPGELVDVAYKQEIKEGTAYIRSWVSGEEKDYEIIIKKIHLGRMDASKGLEIEVTDPELVGLTGGIVQGMSGSPILQDGKLIGAVTHVFVNNPTQGYGIFIENMLEKQAE